MSVVPGIRIYQLLFSPRLITCGKSRKDKHLQWVGIGDAKVESMGNTEAMFFLWLWGWESKCFSGLKSLPV